MEREGMERCLEQVAAYRASGQKAKAWAQANGVPLRALASWCAHARRWQARLDGVVAAAPARRGRRLRGRARCAAGVVGHGAHRAAGRRHAAWSCTGRWRTRANSPPGCARWADDPHRGGLAGARRERSARGHRRAARAGACAALPAGRRRITPTCSPTGAPTGSRCWSTTARACGCARGACRPAASPGRARTAGALALTREQFDWLVAGLPWQRLSAPQPQRHHGGLMALHLRGAVMARLSIGAMSRFARALRARHDGGHARSRGRRHPMHRRDAPASRCTLRADRAPAGRVQVRADPDRGAELRDRAPEALALRLVQREPGAASTQAVLFDAIVADTALEDGAAAQQAASAAPQARSSAGGAPGTAREAAAHRASPRDRADALRLRPAVQAHRRRRQRAARLRAGAVLRARHIRGKYACACCQTIQAAPMPAQIIDKGHPGAGPAGAGGRGQARRSPAAVPADRDLCALGRAHRALEHGAVDRHLRRAPGAAGRGAARVHPRPQAVVHADETPVSLLAPGSGKTKRAYVWVYRTTELRGPARGAVRLLH